eukprot:gene12704-14009_t
MDLVRTRLAAQGEGVEKKYRGITHCFSTILKEEGGWLSGSLSEHGLAIPEQRHQSRRQNQRKQRAASTMETILWFSCRSSIQTCKEGLYGLYKGNVPNLAKVAPAIGIQFAVYEVTRSMLYGEKVRWMH